MLHKNKLCIDAGTQHCPCRLAATGDCLVCSRLSQKTAAGAGTAAGIAAGCCDCEWQGVCIYNEYLQNGGRQAGCDPAGSSATDRRPGLAQQRESRICKIQQIKWYGKDLAVMRVEVPRGFAEKASLPGSCVFLKPPEAEDFYYMPISVMRASHEDGYVDLAVQKSGPKSRELLEAWMPQSGLCEVQDTSVTDFDGMVEVRGVYRNGLLGVAKLLSPEPKRVLCLAKGVGLVPLANYCRWAGRRDRIDFIIDTDKITENFVRDCMAGCDAESIKTGRLPLNISRDAEEQYDVIVLSASDYYQEKIYIPEHKKVLSNNHAMCCGEGICGACIFMDQNGKGHRMCKCTGI